ncbi:MAG: hypothetical protein E7472_02940 [Ruminococcaceae bacterium]|nr:hypothetical protein [Oscillospiraceae bacterium]
MNGIDKISNRLIEDAKADIEKLNLETQAQCDAIIKEYELKAQTEYDAIVSEGEKACEVRVRRLASTADMEAKKAILAFKQELVAKAFSDAVDQLVHLPREQYVEFLAAQAAAAAAYGTEELLFNDRDAKTVGADAAKAANAILKQKGIHGGLTVSEETREIPGGVIVRQGNIEVNCAVDTLVQMSRGELASQVAEILFT